MPGSPVDDRRSLAAAPCVFSLVHSSVTAWEWLTICFSEYLGLEMRLTASMCPTSTWYPRMYVNTILLKYLPTHQLHPLLPTHLSSLLLLSPIQVALCSTNGSAPSLPHPRERRRTFELLSNVRHLLVDTLLLELAHAARA